MAHLKRGDSDGVLFSSPGNSRCTDDLQLRQCGHDGGAKMARTDRGWDGGGRAGAFSQAYSVPDQIVGSVERMDEGFLFQIPADTPFPEKLDIHIAGRVEYGDGFSASVHYLEEENGNWVPGKAYFISADPACTELTLDVSCPDEEGKLLHRTVDLLEIR